MAGVTFRDVGRGLEMGMGDVCVCDALDCIVGDG